MDWAAYINHNRDALMRLLAGLFAAVGLVEGGPVLRLPPHLRAAVLFVLRPAESAARRLIFAQSQEMSVPQYAPRAAFNGEIPRGDGSGVRVPPFQLFDSRKSFPELSQGGKRPRAGAGPRMFFFDGSDTALEPEPEKPAHDPEDAARLCGRMRALHKALDDIPAQARRMLRAMAKRAAAPPGPKRYGPLRPGNPPGHRQRWRHEVDDILKDCHDIALRMRAAPNTS